MLSSHFKCQGLLLLQSKVSAHNFVATSTMTAVLCLVGEHQHLLALIAGLWQALWPLRSWPDQYLLGG